MLSKILFLFAVVIFISAPVQADTWMIDKDHSSIGFSVRHMVISKVKGFFADYEGEVNFNGKNIEGGSTEIKIKVASINTDNAKRDDHLRSPEFFDVIQFPEMVFKSTQLFNTTKDHFALIGYLTIKGVAKEIRMECDFNGLVTDPWGNSRAGFSATTTINRQDFNVAWDNKLQDGSLIVGNDITINLEIELIKAKPEQTE